MRQDNPQKDDLFEKFIAKRQPHDISNLKLYVGPSMMAFLDGVGNILLDIIDFGYHLKTQGFHRKTYPPAAAAYFQGHRFPL